MKGKLTMWKPFFTFDFRAMEQSNKNANSQYELNFDLTVAAAGQICKILVIEAATIQLTLGGSKTDRVI